MPDSTSVSAAARGQPPVYSANHSEARKSAPLVVDVDGTLIRHDLFWEGVLDVASHRPQLLPRLVVAGLGGKAPLKRFLACHARLSLGSFPIVESVAALISDARASGQTVVLASGSDQTQVDVLAKRVGADLAFGSNGDVNLSGRRKLAVIRRHFESFDYVGNAPVDIPLWIEARTAYATGMSRAGAMLARRRRPGLLFLDEPRSLPRIWIRALRPHQWSKNVLILLPALAAHLALSTALLVDLVAGFIALSMVASAVYLINDLSDLPHDRVHPTKRARPLAAGALSIPAAVAGAVGLVAAGVGIAAALPDPFLGVLLIYLVSALGYSYILKRHSLTDVVCLALLYTIRVFAGGALAGVQLSRWFLAFMVFVFLSLALSKRVIELRRLTRPGGELSGRGYVAADLPVLVALGLGAVNVSSLVYCLYITSDDVTVLYGRPEFLWLGLPILLYWQGRIWLSTVRGEIDDDPLVTVLRDWRSYVIAVLMMLVILLAT